MKIYKFGGTSVGSAENITKVIRIIDNHQRKIVVFSAMSGTTNALVSIIEYLKNNDTVLAFTAFREIIKKYISTSYDLLKTPLLIKHYHTFLQNYLQIFESIILEKINLKVENQILSFGEMMTVELIKNVLLEKNIHTVMLYAPDFIRLNEQDYPDYEYTQSQISAMLEKNSTSAIFITQGFICKNAQEEIDNLKRGGSDYTATILGAACDAKEIQIWSDIDGLHNNDPRYVDFTEPISELSYEEAEELAYFGAKVLHPTCIYPAKLKQIPILLKNTFHPDAAGTAIYNHNNISYNIKAVAAKDGITAIKIHSGRMFQVYGFLKKIFEIFEYYKTPVDMVTTSEVSVSVTIDNTSALTQITKELETLGMVEVYTGQSIICVVGNFKSDQKGIISEVLECINHIPLRMISYGASENNLTFLVNESMKTDALISLHKKLLQKNNLFLSFQKN